MTGDEVTVRELRQNPSVYLRRVQHGESLAVTSRGERVAVLGPIGGGSRLDRLTAEGRISSPRVAWTDPDPTPLSQGTPGLTDTVLRMREEQEH